MFSSTLEKEGSTYYYDMMIFNNSRSGTVLSFQEQRQNSILPLSSDNYRMSIIRFSADSNLPTIIPQVMTSPNTDPNKLIYSFTMTFKTYSYQQYINFQPQNMAVAVPTSADLASRNVIENPYYWIYDSMSFINMLNDGLSACWNNLKTLVVAGGDVLPNSAPNIYLEMNPTTNIINLVADSSQYDIGLANPINLWMNTPLHSLLKAFEGLKFYGYTQPLGKDVLFTIKNYNNLNNFTNAGISYLLTYSEYSALGSWSPVNSLVITSSLPVKNTLISTPNVVDDQFQSNFPINLSEKQITDLQLTSETNINSTGKITYTAQVYRYITLENSPNINNVQINFYWKSKLGNYFDFILDGSGLASIKIMFEKV